MVGFLKRESLGHLVVWALIVAAMLTALGYWAYTPDDGFIHLTFSRNLVSTGTFAFSAGIPVNGSTSPLWNLVIAIPVLLGMSPLVAIKLLGFLFTVLTIWLASRLMFRIAGPGAGWTIGFVLCCDPWLLRWAVSGLETSMVVALLMGSLTLLYHRRLTAGCALSGFLPLARPETALYVLLYATVVAWRRPVRETLGHLALMSVPVLIWGLYAYVQFGSVVQNSVRSKTLNYADGLLERAVTLVKIGVVSHGVLLAVAAGLMLLGWHLQKSALPAPLRLLLLIWPPLLLVGFVASGSAVVSRYYLPGTVVAYLPVVAWLATQRPALRLGVPLVSCGVSLVFSFFLLGPGVREYAQNFNRATIEISDSLNALTGPGDIVAARDIGYLGYYNRSGYTILDLAGLVTPEMLKGDADRDAHVLRQQPRFVVERGKVADAIAERERLEHFGIDAFLEAGALRFEATSYLGLPGLSAKSPEWYTLYSVDVARMERVFELAGVPD